MITITKEQAEAIRSDARSIGMHIVQPDADPSHDVYFDNVTVRTLLRLGLCVVESDVTPLALGRAMAGDPSLNGDKVDVMLDALATEMSR